MVCGVRWLILYFFVLPILYDSLFLYVSLICWAVAVVSVCSKFQRFLFIQIYLVALISVLLLLTHTRYDANNGRSQLLFFFFYFTSHAAQILSFIPSQYARDRFFIYVRRELYSIIHLQFVHHVLFSAHIMTTYRMATSNVQRTRSLTQSQHLTLDVFFFLTHVYVVLVCGCAPVVCMSLSFRQPERVLSLWWCYAVAVVASNLLSHTHTNTSQLIIHRSHTISRESFIQWLWIHLERSALFLSFSLSFSPNPSLSLSLNIFFICFYFLVFFCFYCWFPLI